MNFSECDEESDGLRRPQPDYSEAQSEIEASGEGIVCRHPARSADGDLGMSYVLPAEACDRDTAVYAWGGDGWSRAALPAQSAPRDGVRYRRGPDFCRRRCFYSDRAGPDGQAFHPFGSTRLTGSILRSFNCVVSEHARPRPGPSGSSSEL